MQPYINDVLGTGQAIFSDRSLKSVRDLYANLVGRKTGPPDCVNRARCVVVRLPSLHAAIAECGAGNSSVIDRQGVPVM